MQSSEFDFLPRVSQFYAQTSTGEAPSDRVDAPSTDSFAYDAALLLVPIGFVAVWAAVVCVISDTWKVRRKDMGSARQIAQLPCKKCRFFHNNPYVKCAVNPEIALTRDAVDCSDFRPRDRNSPNPKERKS
jgi:hypothetical protein